MADQPLLKLNVRGILAFPSLIEPSAQPAKPEDLRYRATLLIPKGDADNLAAAKRLFDDAYQRGLTTKWGGKKPPAVTFKNPLRDGDEEKANLDGFAGCWFINATTRRKPAVVRRDLTPITREEDIWGGQEVVINLSAYPFSNQSNGVAFSLETIMILGPGEHRLGGGAVDPAEAFAGIAEPSANFDDTANPFAEPGGGFDDTANPFA